MKIFFLIIKNPLLSPAIKDIIPLPWNEGYEGFEVLAEKANNWLKDQKDEVKLLIDFSRPSNVFPFLLVIQYIACS